MTMTSKSPASMAGAILTAAAIIAYKVAANEAFFTGASTVDDLKADDSADGASNDELESKCSPVPASSLSKFMELQPEIRTKIWELAMDESRIIRIISRPLSERDPLPSAVPEGWDCALKYVDREELDALDLYSRLTLEPCPEWEITSVCPAPILLSVCWEAHEIASKHYKKAFSRPPATAETSFNFDKDIFYLSEAASQIFVCETCRIHFSLYLRTISDINKICNLAIRVKSNAFIAHRLSFERQIFDLTGMFPALKQLTFVVEYSAIDYHSAWPISMSHDLPLQAGADIVFHDPISVPAHDDPRSSSDYSAAEYCAVLLQQAKKIFEARRLEREIIHASYAAEQRERDPDWNEPEGFYDPLFDVEYKVAMPANLTFLVPDISGESGQCVAEKNAFPLDRGVEIRIF